jgi:lipoprotein NlpI
MSNHLKKINPRVLLYGFIFICAIFLMVLFLSANVGHKAQTNDQLLQEEGLPEELSGKSSFEIGQYYFNHDEDPEGPYDIKKAQEYFRHAVEEDPEGNEQAWYQLGRTQFIEGDFVSALQSFDSQIHYFGTTVPNVYYMIGLTYGYQARQNASLEDWGRAENAFLQFIEFAPYAPWSRVDLAWIYFSQGKFEAMKAPLEEGLSYEPNNPWLLNMYGLMLLNTGDKELAFEAFIKAKDQAQKLSVEDWGRAYPGNSPQAWEQGLSEFRSIIEKNIILSKK